jgi:hypothetical protein
MMTNQVSWLCSTDGRENKCMQSWKNSKKRHGLEDPGINGGGGMILKYILNIWFEREWSNFFGLQYELAAVVNSVINFRAA